jgi:hypothetical protein
MDKIRINKRLTGKPQGKRSFGRLKHKQENNIKMNLTERQCEGMDQIQAAQHNI